MRFATTLRAALVLGALLLAPLARAEDAWVEGTVLGADGTDLVVDLGTSRGASDGTTVELWRTVRIKHPVTGQMLTDRFLVGKLRLTQVRPNLALAQPSGELTRVPQPGDVVRLAKATLPVTTLPPPIAVVPVPAPTNVDADAQSLSALFESLREKTPQFRAAAYEAYARTHPQSRFVTVLIEEAAALRKADAAPVAAPVAAAPRSNPVEAKSFRAATDAFANTPLEVAIELSGDYQGAVLFAYSSEKSGYVPMPMKREGDGYFAATIPPALVATPRVKYFIEASGSDGAMVPVEGTSEVPLAIEVRDKPSPMAPIPVRIQFSLWTDFATWNTKKFDDYASQTEGLFGVRFGDTGVRAIRTGFGVYRGVGGTLDQLDSPTGPSKVGLTYGYLETELAPATIYSIVVRAVVGLGQDGIGGGMQGFMRIGSDRKTNLLVGGEVLSGVGLRGIAQLEWSAAPRWPIMFRTEVTNQPIGTSGGDVGVRLIAQAGFRITDRFTAALRASYQGRTINHAGPGGGAAVEYSW